MRILISFFVFVSLVSAEVFDIPPSNNWTKVQDGEIVQWSIIPLDHPKTRVDLLSYTEGGQRTTYYLIRSVCPDGKVVSGVIKAGNKTGLGLNCSGDLAVKTAAITEEVENRLPKEALLLFQK